jgi:zinc protease
LSWPPETPPGPLPAREVRFPPYELQTLPNGLQVVAVLHHEQPVLSMRVVVRAGSASDPKGKLGLASLVASLLDQGTTTRSAQELADVIDFVGGTMGTEAGTDLSHLNMVVMKDSFETGLEMLSDMARRPAFAPAEIERQRQQIVSGLLVSQEDPGHIANTVFDRLVYGFHPYGMPQSGTSETISAITRDDLVAFHRRYFVPNNAILAIVGDVTAEEAFAGARKAFGDWERRDVVADTLVDPPDPTGRVIVVNKPDAVQTELRVGHLGVGRKNADYMALNLAIRILGGEGSNRLNQVLRTKRGLTYGAQVDMDTLRQTGDFEAQTNTRSEATGEVLRLIVDEFWRLQRDRVGERELTDAKAYLTGSFPLTIETPDQIALQILNVVFYELPIEELQSFRQRVNAITPDDIQRVARTYLKPDRLSVVLVGNATAFASQLEGVGFGSFETVELTSLDLTAVDFKQKSPGVAGKAGKVGWARGGRGDLAHRPSSQQSVQTPAPPAAITREEEAKARELLDRAVAARGGLEKLRAIRNITAVSTEVMTGPDGQTATAQTTTYLEYPDHVRVEIRLPEATIVQGFDGQHAWVQDQRGVRSVPDALVQELQTGLKRDAFAWLLAPGTGAVRARALPAVKDETGARFQALDLSAPALEPIVLYLDPSGVVTKQTSVAGGAGQPLVEELFADHRVVDGVQVAFATTVRRGGQPIVERRLADFTINAPIAPALFKRPSP